MLAPLDQAGRNAVQDAFDSLVEASPLLFLASPAERLFAITGQMALSVIVWFAAVKKEKWGLLPLAVLMAKAGAPILLIEAEVLAVVILIVLCARTIWKRESLS